MLPLLGIPEYEAKRYADWIKEAGFVVRSMRHYDDGACHGVFIRRAGGT
jgi:hypothetical protein